MGLNALNQILLPTRDWSHDSRFKFPLPDSNFLTWFLIGWRLCRQPIRSHVRKWPSNSRTGNHVRIASTCITTASRPANITILWKKSTHTTALNPPYKMKDRIHLISRDWVKLQHNSAIQSVVIRKSVWKNCSYTGTVTVDRLLKRLVTTRVVFNPGLF